MKRVVILDEDAVEQPNYPPIGRGKAGYTQALYDIVYDEQLTMTPPTPNEMMTFAMEQSLMQQRIWAARTPRGQAPDPQAMLNGILRGRYR